MLFYWYQSYHWYQWRPFFSPVTPMESICEYWTTLTKTIGQNQRMRLLYTHYNSRSAARVGPRTHVNSLLHKRPSKITTLCGNVSVCRRHNNILYRRNDGFPNKLTKQCSSWTPGMLRQKFDGTTPRKSKAMIMQCKSTFTGPIQALRPGNNIIKWTTSERLLGLQVDNKLSRSDHAANVAKSFASQLSLLRHIRFLPQNQLEDFCKKWYCHHWVTYGLTAWGSCNKTHLNNPEKLHARAGRIVYGLPWDNSAEDVLLRTGWDSLETMYKLRLTEFVFKCLKY